LDSLLNFGNGVRRSGLGTQHVKQAQDEALDVAESIVSRG
jgi:hypothetical protein